MKRKFYFIAGLAALAMLFAACSNLDEAENTSSSTRDVNGSGQVLTLSLNDASFDIARTVYPGDWTNGSKAELSNDLANKLVYVLTGYTVENDTSVDKGSDSADFTDPNTPSNKYVVLTYEDLMNGTAQVKLKPLVWYFTLTAYGTLEDPSNTGTATNKTLTPLTPNSEGVIQNTEVCLVGTMHADMTNGENKVVFNMVPPIYVKDETGKYAITTDAIGTAKYAVSFTPPDSFWYMTYAFYPEDADTYDTPSFTAPASDAIKSAPAKAYFVKKAGATASDPITLVESTYTAPASPATIPTFADVTDGKAYTTEANSDSGYSLTYKMYDTDGTTGAKTGITHYLTAGKYWFRAEFYDTNNKRLLIHTEKFVIDGINTSADEVMLNYKTFSSAPQNIQELSLQYTYNNVTFDEDPVSLYAAHHARDKSDGSDSAYPKTYEATLSWEDVADNEIGYQLWLRTYDTATSAYTEEVFTPEDLEDSTSDAKTKYKITTLAAGINSTKIELETGVKYEIRLRAFNDRSVEQNATGNGAYGTVWGTYALSAEKAGYDYFVPYIPRRADYDDTDATSLAASDINFGLFTIDYNLNGGKIKQTSAKTSDKLHYTIPYIYKESVNKLIDTNEFPYIDRAGYDFIGWNELYGNTGVTIDGKVGTKEVSGGKPYYSHPNYGESTFIEGDKVTIPSGATVSLDSIVRNRGASEYEPLTKSESLKDSANKTLTADGSLATYTYTVSLDAEDTTGDYDGHVVSTVTTNEGTKYIYSNLLQAGSDIPEAACENRELYASWETPLAMSIKLPAYPSFKLTKIAAAGDPIEYAISADSTKNKMELKASDKLSNLSFKVYYDDSTATDAGDVLTGTAVTSIDATGTGTPDTTSGTTVYTSTDGKATLAVPTVGANETAMGGTFSWNYDGKTAGVYILKVSGTYTYAQSKTNSLEKQSDIVEGYIYIRLTN